MLTLSSLDELQTAKERLANLQQSFPALFDRLVHVTNLTRALNFKYQYMGCLLMDEDPGTSSPNFVQASVLRLYKKEVQLLKNDVDFDKLKQFFTEFKGNGYAKLSLLALGIVPESLTGAPIIK
ncbi:MULTISPECIES: hypothetical protein [Heyndrickxia]|jgi:hypothetical protein|uniref:Uncharacterized protein n=1 Tax=Heyndrickxia oleronia TaxID=38875 RepID=A0A8E2I550_9BACI|nr:hypothetical protein [Heyndrickxia oleronia]NYV63955.1 hypothetical protein [Bacillus sp. Gen3]MBU5212782.1 hypothetical protein [Heyndrickxia oleronia]MCI1590583.1 hypothetical protein [Heyndrickxia oleronia]MCI1614287.1 hypothetical protein [Heyndrickxia oleronia]MCI1745057.1 hypothetical protein [Heyndrickxia oleronia]